RAYFDRVEEADPGAIAFFYIYRLNHEGCAAPKKNYRGHYDPRFNAGGTREARAYRRWITGFAECIASHHAVVFLEPDGLGTLDCLPPAAKKARFGLLRYAIAELARDPNTTVYLDAGPADWQPLATMVARLRAAGVAKVRGFFLNSTHYD